MNKEYFIKKAQEIHGNKYDYSLVEVSRSKDKVKIICPIHGVFVQEANSHLQGRGCAICSGKKFDLDTFIRKANKIWNNKYDYSKVVYTGTNNKVCIICPEHGEFWQTVSNHLKGQCACKECRGKSKDFKVIRSKEDFVKAANEKYNYKFDYSKVDYKNTCAKVCIICPEHGEFWQLPQDHVRGHGCFKCRTEHLAEVQSISKEQWLKLVIEKYNNKFDYSKVNYINYISPVTIICPIHGEFETTPINHYKSETGCSKCGREKANKSESLTLKEFIQKANLIHGNKYDYSKVVYVNNYTPITIICPEHGEFQQKPLHHLVGQGCSKCHL